MIKYLFQRFIFLYRIICSKKVRIFIKQSIKFVYYKLRFIKLKVYLLLTKNNVDLILGAALTKQNGWFSTNEEWLDISKKKDWERLFLNNQRLRKVLAEHVFEHLSLDEMRKALKLIFRHMVSGGSIRIAVPDGNNPNKEYRRHCGINGIGADASDHKQFITFEVLKDELEKVGFKVFLIEGYKHNQQLISKKFNDQNGKIIRSRNNQFSLINKNGWEFKDSKTSLIVDCYK